MDPSPACNTSMGETTLTTRTRYPLPLNCLYCSVMCMNGMMRSNELAQMQWLRDKRCSQIYRPR